MSSPEVDGSGRGGSVRSRSPSPTSNRDTVQFNEANGRDGFAIRPGVAHIDVFPSAPEQMNETSPFQFSTVVDYQWETQYAYGKMIATHTTSKFIAYVVKVNNVGAVRVIDMDTKERVLMKGDKGLIKDVDFLHKPDEIVIAFIDEYGTFYVNKIVKGLNGGQISTRLLVKVSLDGSPYRSEFRRFVWCKYVPDKIEDVPTPRDCAYHFAVLQNDVIYASNLIKFTNSKGSGSFSSQDVREEFLIIDAHSGPVTDASFAPDGTALATASKDGTVKFFQIYFQDHNEPARCLFSWAPHEGSPVDKIFFLDDHTFRETSAESQYWKFMITASKNMSELKLYTCKTWDCLQTLQLNTAPSQWKMDINVTGEYLVATNIHTKGMYMIHLEFDDDGARFHWVREFPMPWNIISFNISSAILKSSDALTRLGHDVNMFGDYAELRPEEELNMLEVNIVQPRSLQQGIVILKAPEFFCRANGHHRISFNKDVVYRNINGDNGDPHIPSAETLATEDEDQDDALEPTSTADTILSTSRSTLALNPSPRGSRSSSLEPNSPSIPVSTSKRRSTTSSVSPRTTPKEVPSVAEMSEQLSSLIGLGGKTPPAISRTNATSVSSVSSKGRSISPHFPPNGNFKVSSVSSSPSREVEEILSPKNVGNFGGLQLTPGHEETQPLSATAVMSAAIGLENFENGNIPVPSRKTKSLTAASDQMYYPQIPQVLEKVNSLVDMMVMQANEIKELKKEVSRLTLIQGASLDKGKEGSTIVVQSVDKHFKNSQMQLNRMEEILRDIDNVEKQRNTQGTSGIPSNLAEVLATAIGSIVKTEVQSVIPNTMDKMFDPSRLQISSLIDRMSTVVETKITQNISQMLHKEKIWQGVTSDFHSITKVVFEQCFNDLFMTTVFPRVQNAIRELLDQTNQTFVRGTREYLNGLETQLDSHGKQYDIQEIIKEKISSMQDTLSSTLQVEIESQMLRILGGLQSGVVRNIEESMTRELAKAFQEQQRYFEISVIPRTATPAVSVTDHHSLGGGGATHSDPALVQRNLLALAKSGDLHNAFVQASNHGDVNVLLHLCKNFDPSSVFECKLPPHVHVSIMHLLALDILEDTDTKLNYLHVGLGSLDTSDRKTLKSVFRMIPVFQAAVGKYLERNPDARYSTNIKLLEMAFNGIGMQLKSPSAASQHSYSQYN